MTGSNIKAVPEDQKVLADLFPMEETTFKPPKPEEPAEAIEKRLRTVQQEACNFEDEDDGIADISTRYVSYRSVDDLPAVGRSFYDLAAKQAGLSTTSLLKAVNMFELQVRAWRRKQRRGKVPNS